MLIEFENPCLYWGGNSHEQGGVIPADLYEVKFASNVYRTLSRKKGGRVQGLVFGPTFILSPVTRGTFHMVSEYNTILKDTGYLPKTISTTMLTAQAM